jgi:colanic acid biosynthesis glycosyl transferase WcaI
MGNPCLAACSNKTISLLVRPREASFQKDLDVRVIFINRFFFPDHSATSQMLSDLAFELARRSMTVEIITSRQRYDAPDIVLPARETTQGVEIHRVWTSRFGRANLIGRAVDYLTFYLTAAWMLWRIVRRGDVVVAKTDPPMVSVVAWPVARLRGAKLINWMQDIFPEIAERVGVGGGRASKLGFRAMRWLRDLSLKGADVNVAVGERMAEHLSLLGIPPARIQLIANWADGDFIRPVARKDNPLRNAWGLGDDFVVGYSGNLGRAHEAGTLVAAIAAVKQAAASDKALASGRPRVRWLFIGGGALIDGMRQQLTQAGVAGEVEFRPYAPREHLAESLSAADVQLVSLRSELEGLVVPSKIYGIAAAGRPAIFIGDRDGEVARLVTRFECGRTVAQGDGQALARTVLELASQPELCAAMGARARKIFESDFDKPAGADRWQALLTRVAAGR